MNKVMIGYRKAGIAALFVYLALTKVVFGPKPSPLADEALMWSAIVTLVYMVVNLIETWIERGNDTEDEEQEDDV